MVSKGIKLLETVDVVPFLLVFPATQFNQILGPVEVIPVGTVGNDLVPVGGKQRQQFPGDRPENRRLVPPVEIGVDPLQNRSRVDSGFDQRGQAVGGSLVGTEENGVI